MSPRNVLGDIVSSAPLFVGKPPFLYPDIFPGGTETPYSTFVAAHDTPAERAHMVYAGANDGMLHAFDAVTGEERLGFIPGGVFPNLHLLTSTTYTHQYYVDGPPTMGDAFFGGTWHTMLVGGLNKGGKSIYALDITTPGSFSEANATSIFKWEFTDAADLGFTYSRPAIVRLPERPLGCGLRQWLQQHEWPRRALHRRHREQERDPQDRHRRRHRRQRAVDAGSRGPQWRFDRGPRIRG